MMSWLWPKWMICLFCFSLSTSAEAANQMIIGRGYLPPTYTSQDIFIYTASICGNESYVNTWCFEEKNAYQLSAVIASSFMCACYCRGDFPTFLSKEENCVSISHLKTLEDFGNGTYQFIPQADFTKASNIQLSSTFLPNCEKCKVDNISYFKKDGWKTFQTKDFININKKCKLTWKSKSEKLAGKILKIQFRECTTSRFNSLFLFLKSNGSYTPPPCVINLIQHVASNTYNSLCRRSSGDVIGASTSHSSTVAATISSSMDSTETTTFTSSSTSTVTPTPASTVGATISSSMDSTYTPTFTSSFTSTVTPTPASTVGATISSSMDSTETTTFTSSFTSTVTPTPALKASTHQVPEFVTTPQVSPTRTLIIVSSHVCSSGDICPSSSSVAVLLPTTAIQSPTNRTLGYQNSLGSSTWAIIAAVVACILVGGIIALFVVLRRRRRDNRRARFSKDPAKVPTPDTDNPMYGHNRGDVISLSNRQSGHTQKDEDEEYDYATVDGVRSDHQKPSTPIYQSLIKDNVGSSVYDPLNKVATTPMEYSYNHLQHPQYNPARSKSDPLYNTLEIPDDDEYQEPETQIIDNPTGVSEPVYNVLEGPDANSAPHDDDPVYNVLEDPNTNQDNDPVYNVLEGPDDDYDNAPIDDDQNIPASGQDNVTYSSTIDLNIPQSPSSPDYDVLEDPEGALPDSTYQPLSIRVQDDVYQTLDRASQSIYQTLEPNDSKA